MDGISIVVCNYNNGHFFETAFRSLLQQTCQDFEVIVIDDASTDDSVKVIQKIITNDPRTSLYRNEKNRGYAFSLDKGIRLAHFPLVARLDPDDALNPNAVEETLQAFEKLPKIIATYSRIYFCDEVLHPEFIYSRSEKIKNGQTLFFNIRNEVSHFFAFKKEAYLKTEGIDLSLSSAVDFDLYLKLYEVGDFYFIPKPLYRYRKHVGGISQDPEKKKRSRANWNQVLRNTCLRRGITKIEGVQITGKTDLATLLFKREQRLDKRLTRAITKYLNRK